MEFMFTTDRHVFKQFLHIFVQIYEANLLCYISCCWFAENVLYIFGTRSSRGFHKANVKVSISYMHKELQIKPWYVYMLVICRVCIMQCNVMR